MNEEEVFSALESGKKLVVDILPGGYFKLVNNKVLFYFWGSKSSSASFNISTFKSCYADDFVDFTIENKLTIYEAEEELKKGKKLRATGWSVYECIYIRNNSVIKRTKNNDFSIEDRLCDSNDFTTHFYNDVLFTLIEPEKTSTHTYEKFVCKSCNGSGILDFGFYTRKCMKCNQE